MLNCATHGKGGPDEDLEGKLALVTGGGKGIGKVVAGRLAARGAHILLNYFHSLDQAKQTKAELEAAGAAIDLVRASVAQKVQVARMFEEIEEKYGYLDILINNAAAGRLVPVSGVDEEDFARALDTNLKGSFWCARAAAPLMARRGGGCIVNLSSIGADLVPANYVVVGTSKAGLEALTRYLAVEFAPLNIRVNTASCTLVEGDVAHLFPDSEEVIATTIASTPLGRLATADDLAGLIDFLTSDQSRLMTGQTVLADGGLSLGSVMMSPRSKTPPVALPAQPDGVATAPDGAAGPGEGLGESDDLAIVGMGLVVPGANSPEEFWRILIEGPDLFQDAPAERWDSRSFFSDDVTAEDKTYAAGSAFITDFKPIEGLADGLSGGTERRRFDQPSGCATRCCRHFAGCTAATATATPSSSATRPTAVSTWKSRSDPRHVHRLAEAMEQTSVPPVRRRRCRSPSTRRSAPSYWRGAEEPIRYLPHNIGRSAMEGVLPDGTELMMVDTACSSSLYAVDIGIKGLLTGRHDIAVCGGSFALAPRGSVLFSKLHGLSASGAGPPARQGRRRRAVLRRRRRGRAEAAATRARGRRPGAGRAEGLRHLVGRKGQGDLRAELRRPADRHRAGPRRERRTDGQATGIDWVVAHATGTPAGDLAEFDDSARVLRGGPPVYVTSNKSLIGHTGWAAGVASLIKVVLGLQHETIPPQHRFSEPPADFDMEKTKLTIPTAPVPWPDRPDTPRRVAISGFGFGGTNAHLIVEEYPSPAAAKPVPTPRPYTGRLAVVGWSACLPGLDTPEEVAAWLAGDWPGARAVVRRVLSAAALREGAHAAGADADDRPLPVDGPRVRPRAPAQLGAFWDANRERTGVFLGHMGATRNATLYAGRCYLDDIERTLRAGPTVGSSLRLRDRRSPRCARRFTGSCPPSNENSFPGMMPNVIPARIANYFDLKGLNMTIDTGASAALAAIRPARYLRSGELTWRWSAGSTATPRPRCVGCSKASSIPAASNSPRGPSSWR